MAARYGLQLWYPVKLLDVDKFDHSRWFEGVFIIGEPNDEPRRSRLMHNGGDPMCPALGAAVRAADGSKALIADSLGGAAPNASRLS